MTAQHHTIYLVVEPGVNSGIGTGTHCHGEKVDIRESYSHLASANKRKADGNEAGKSREAAYYQCE